MKITVLGGGGVRSMFLAKSIAQKAKRLGIDELCFMDNDEEKLRILQSLAAEGFDQLDQGAGKVLEGPAELIRHIAQLGRRAARSARSRKWHLERRMPKSSPPEGRRQGSD